MARFLSRRTHGALLAGQAGLLVAGGRISESYIQLDCPIRSLTGWQCPGCGSSRCVSALGVGDIEAGFRHNPLLTAAIVGSLTFSFVGVLSPSRADHVLKTVDARQRVLTWLLLMAIIGFTGLRNVY